MGPPSGLWGYLNVSCNFRITVRLSFFYQADCLSYLLIFRKMFYFQMPGLYTFLQRKHTETHHTAFKDQENVAPAALVITFGELAENYQSSLPQCTCQNLRAIISSLDTEDFIRNETVNSYRSLWVTVDIFIGCLRDAGDCGWQGTVSLPWWNEYFATDWWSVCPMVSKRPGGGISRLCP